jgi:uncharacterized MnhB-related membrane protein
MFVHLVIAAATLACAVQAVRATRLLTSALWLAGDSALVALLIYLLGAPEVAVIELSVGAGLVTVLFVFAINIAGEEVIDTHTIVPRPLSWGLIVLALILLGWLTLPRTIIPLPESAAVQFARMLWQDRGLDVLLQVVLIFSGVLGVLGLLAEGGQSKEAKP